MSDYKCLCFSEAKWVWSKNVSYHKNYFEEEEEVSLKRGKFYFKSEFCETKFQTSIQSSVRVYGYVRVEDKLGNFLWDKFGRSKCVEGSVFPYQCHLLNFCSKDQQHIKIMDIITGKSKFIQFVKIAIEVFLDGTTSSGLCKRTENCSIQCGAMTSLMHSFEDLSESDSKEMVTLRVRDGSITANKAVLVASSPVFSAIFASSAILEQDGAVIIQDLSLCTMKNLIKYMCTSHVNEVDFEQMQHLYYAACHYQISSLKLQCTEMFLNMITLNNVIQMLKLAQEHNDDNLRRAVMAYMQIRIKDLLALEEFEDLMKNQPKLALAVFKRPFMEEEQSPKPDKKPKITR